jgi:hypothetical protein
VPFATQYPADNVSDEEHNHRAQSNDGRDKPRLPRPGWKTVDRVMSPGSCGKDVDTVNNPLLMPIARGRRHLAEPDAAGRGSSDEAEKCGRVRLPIFPKLQHIPSAFTHS